MGSKQIPSDKINLRLILVSGKTREFLFSPNASAAEITQHVYDNWPEDWVDEQLPASNILRLIYQGRFLHGNVTLGALQLPLGKTTVMHLVARERLPEPNNQGQLKKDKSGEGTCSNCCSILWGKKTNTKQAQTGLKKHNMDQAQEEKEEEEEEEEWEKERKATNVLVQNQTNLFLNPSHSLLTREASEKTLPSRHPNILC